MAANRFNLDGEKIDSQSDFLAREENGEWKNLLYYPEALAPTDRHPLIFTDKTFTKISFKDTDIVNVRFIRCTFNTCLFIGASVSNCEFIDCVFVDTNTSKLRISGCLLDPMCFDKNFDFKTDTNIAIDLYHAVYKNASIEHQQKHALDSLFMMKTAERHHLDSQRAREIIDTKTYLKRKSAHVFENFVSGYGLKISRVIRLLLIVIAVFSILNYAFRQWIFCGAQVNSFVDSIYFTCVTITTLGFGDITPVTQVGKLLVVLQAILGFSVISLFIAAIANRALRPR